MSMELVLHNADINLPQSIANLEQLKEELVPKLEKYNNLVVTEDSIKDAKADKANLNKLKTAIDEQRKTFKKLYLEPYNALETQCKEVIALIDAPIKAIDTQIKAFDEIEKQNKYKELEDHFASLNAPEWIKINNVLNPKWGNKTEKIDSLKAEMAKCLEKYISELDKLMEMYKDFPHKLAIEQKYKATLDFSQAAVYAAELKTSYEREQARKAAEEERRKREQEQAAQMQSQPEIIEPSESTINAPTIDFGESNIIIPPEAQNAVSVEPAPSEPMLKGRFAVECTRSQLIALRDFMKAQGIKFEIIK